MHPIHYALLVVFHVLVGIYGVRYVAESVTDTDLGWFWSVIFGVLAGVAVLPFVLGCFVLRLFGMSVPFVK